MVSGLKGWPGWCLMWHHVMKTLITLAALVTVTALAETPAQIAADYRAKAAPALEKVNTTLEKATVPIIAELVKAGDTTGADEVKAQLKAKQEGEPVMKPHAKAASLFALYDSARLKALEPAQTAAIRRIEALLASSEGKKLDVVDAAKDVRAEIEAGKAPVQAPKIPVEWTYHGTPTSTTNIATVKFQPDGKWEMTEATGQTTTGQWKSNAKGDKITIQLADSVWKATIDGNLATVDRPDVGTRYLRVKGTPVGK